MTVDDVVRLFMVRVNTKPLLHRPSAEGTAALYVNRAACLELAILRANGEEELINMAKAKLRSCFGWDGGELDD